MVLWCGKGEKKTGNGAQPRKEQRERERASDRACKWILGATQGIHDQEKNNGTLPLVGGQKRKRSCPATLISKSRN